MTHVGASDSKPWVRAFLLLAAIYLVDGLAFGALAAAASPQMRVMWRLAAWVTSGMAFVAHIRYERSRLDHSPMIAALHVSLAAALGAGALAAAALIRAISTGSGRPRLLAIALVAWPALTAVPAFLVALAVATVLGRRRTRT